MLYVLLAFVFRKNKINAEQAEKSRPPNLFGIDLYPKRKEGNTIIPWWALLLLFIFWVGLSIWL